MSGGFALLLDLPSGQTVFVPDAPRHPFFTFCSDEGTVGV